ncbi:uncharacterized protein LOC128723752 [Anopheles nili]|uniref:uncharacterized protein LOC128723752 n=1 Tax=Anopheles nili TaxID=185578 RepID=UPI00237B3FEF|nr:uncharacterized protein LOC128723752 [Anopheles nili]
MVILEKIKQHIEKLCAIEEIPDLLKATEKFLTYFHKCPKLMVHLSRMDNYGIMRYVLVIIFEYLIKFDEKEKHDSFIKIAQGIKGQQLQLLEASNIMAWSPELFEIRSRTFLNSIPDKKCYSLAATSAILGVVKLVPIPGRDFISFEWNSNPRELHFEALIGGDDTVKTIEASIELDSMKDLIILG